MRFLITFSMIGSAQWIKQVHFELRNFVDSLFTTLFAERTRRPSIDLDYRRLSLKKATTINFTKVEFSRFFNKWNRHANMGNLIMDVHSIFWCYITWMDKIASNCERCEKINCTPTIYIIVNLGSIDSTN